MDGADDICIICGTCPMAIGPHWLLPWLGLKDECAAIAAEVVSINGDNFDETLGIVSGALPPPNYKDDETIAHLREVMPGLCDWPGFERCVAIGQFDSMGEATVLHGELNSIPDGRLVEVRLVEDYNRGTFKKMLNAVQEDAAVEFVDSQCGDPNIFVSEGCYHYLHAWIDWEALPPRKNAFPSDPAPLPFGAELYEIVNSAEGLRDYTTNALSGIDYDGIVMNSVYFCHARRGSKHLAKAIHEGRRKDELLLAIMRDFRCWMFVRPDLWPLPSEAPQQPYFTAYTPQGNSTSTFSKLPIELLLVILGQTPLTSYFSLSSTCKSFRSLLVAPDFADRVMKESIAHGHLRWISPVDAMPSELDRANEIFRQWISVYVPEEPSFLLDTRNLLLLPHFPCFAFVYACLHSDSMINRKRIWGMVKQYDALWMDYRTNGWKENRFYYMRGSLYHASQARRPVDYVEAET